MNTTEGQWAEEVNERLRTMTEAFVLRDGWHAQWRGQMAAATFTDKGAALAWIDACERNGKWMA